MTYNVIHLPYPGTVNVVQDGDLLRVQYSEQIPDAIVEPHYREWGPNPTSGLEEQWTVDALLYVETSNLINNQGLGAPYYGGEIKCPMQHVVHHGSDQIASQYLGAIRDSLLYVNGRKFGFSSRWDMKIYFVTRQADTVVNGQTQANFTAYATDWFAINMASLPAMDSTEFYADVAFNPISPSPTAPKKGSGKGKGNAVK